MKKLLIATILATGLTAFLPSASADCGERVFVGYDRCGRPVYQQVYRQNYRSYDYQPAYQQSYEPRQSYYSEPRETRYRDYEDVISAEPFDAGVAMAGLEADPLWWTLG